MPPSNHSNKTVPTCFVCLPMASVSGMPPLHSSQNHEIDEDHRRQPNRNCRKLCHETCESPRFLLRCFDTNSNLPSAQGPLQHVKMPQLARIHGHPGARKISEFQNSRAKNWIPGAREQHFLSHLGKYRQFLENVQYIEYAIGRTPGNCFFSLRDSSSNTRSEHLEPSTTGFVLLLDRDQILKQSQHTHLRVCFFLILKYVSNPKTCFSMLMPETYTHSVKDFIKKIQLVTCIAKVHEMGQCYH